MDRTRIEGMAETMLENLLPATKEIPRIETFRRVAIQMFSEGYKAGYGEAYDEKAAIQAQQFEEIDTEEVIQEDFFRFWEMYDKKVNRSKCLKVWRRLTIRERQAIFLYVPLYKRCQPDKRYRKNPLTFLREKAWQDELIPTEYAQREYERQRRAGEADALADILLGVTDKE